MVVNKLKNKDHKDVKVSENNIKGSNLYNTQFKHRSWITNPYVRFFVQRISDANNLDQLNKIFREITNVNNLLKFKHQNFDNNISKMKTGLQSLNEGLILNKDKDVLDKIIRNFVNNNKCNFNMLGDKIYDVDYIKNKILKSFYQNNKPMLVISDIMKLSLTDDKISIPHYQSFENKLFEWLIDNIYKQSNIQFIKNNKLNKNKFIDYHNYKNNYVYLNQNDNFSTQIYLLHNRKKLVEKRRKDELLILSRKYPFSRKYHFDVFNCLKKVKDLPNIKKTIFSSQDMQLPYGNHVTYEDKIYSQVNIFYNKQYIKIDRQERELIKKYKISLREMCNYKKNGRAKQYLIDNLNIKRDLNIIKFWSRPEVDLNYVKGNDKFKQNELEYILNIAANRAKVLTQMLCFKGEDDFQADSLKQLKSVKTSEYDRTIKSKSVLLKALSSINRLAKIADKKVEENNKENQ